MSRATDERGLGWPTIVRLGLVQSALGGVVALCTSTLNRVMVVEYGLPAMLPAALVALHYAVQLSRPAWGHGSDRGGRRTPWIIGGMAMLAVGAVLASFATTRMAGGGLALGVMAFVLIGAGVGAAGTSLLALLANGVAPARRAAAASITWIMMIFGIVLTAGIAGKLLDPFSPARLHMVAAGVAGVAFVAALLAVWGVERGARAVPARAGPTPDFRTAVAGVWADPKARMFTMFVFVSMLAYSAQELILEPFAGLVFRLTPGQSASISAIQHGGVLLGMILVGVAGTVFGRRSEAVLRQWIVAGCVGSAAALALLSMGAAAGPGWPLAPTVFVLGFANGMFAVAAIGSMMALAGGGRGGAEGVRMGLWGGAQAIAFACGGFLGAEGVDAGRHMFTASSSAFIAVFAAEGAVFLAAAWLALRVGRAGARIDVDEFPGSMELAR